MRRFVFIVLVLSLSCSRPGPAAQAQQRAAIVFLRATSGSGGGANTVTISNFDGSGANFLLASLTAVAGVTPFCMPQSVPANTWHPVPGRTDGNGQAQQMFYAYNASVSATMSVSCTTADGLAPAMSLAAFSGIESQSDPLDQANGATSGGVATPSISTQPVTPTSSDQLIVTGLARGAMGFASLIDNAFQIISDLNTGSGIWFNALAFRVLAAPQAVSATWTIQNGLAFRSVTTIASFRKAADIVIPTMTFSQQPATTQTGQAFSPAIAVQITPGAAHSLTLSVNQGPCTIMPAMSTVTANGSGLATFSGVVAGTVGTGCTLRVHNNTNAAVMDIISNPFNVTAIPMPTLTFDVQPSTTVAGQTMMPAVQVRSSMAGFAGPATLSISPCGATLTSGQTVNATAGLAIFSGIVLSGAGTGCTLTATAANHVSVTSAAFDVTLPVPTMTFTQEPSNVITMPGVAAPFVPPIQVTVTPGAAHQIQLSVASGACTLAPTGNLTVTATAGGVATFTGVTVQVAAVPTSCTIRAHNLTNAAVMDVISNPFYVVAPGVGAQHVVGGGIL